MVDVDSADNLDEVIEESGPNRPPELALFTETKANALA